MAAAKKPQSKFHVAKVTEAALMRIELARKGALEDAPNYVNQKFNKKRLGAIEELSDETAALLIAGQVISAGELASARTAAAERAAEQAAAQNRKQ